MEERLHKGFKNYKIEECENYVAKLKSLEVF
jgi:hypothetical protein